MIKKLFPNSSRFVLKSVGDFIFPPLCLICDEYRATDNRWFCPKCHSSLIQKSHSRTPCPICSLNSTQKKCSCDIANPFPFISSHSLFDYDEELRVVLHHIKYHGKKKLAYDIGAQFGAGIPDSFFDKVDFATSIPLHWTRYLKRGYNQAEWIGCGVLKGKGLTIPMYADCIQRTKPTRTQTKLNKESRKLNIANVFKVKNPELISGKNCILFDDVMTTGATTSECARTLIEAGCNSVRVIALVRD